MGNVALRQFRRIGPPMIALVLTLHATFAGQMSRTSAVLEGVVSDKSGAAIEGVEIKLRNAGTGSIRSTRTDERGFFRASELPVGSYEVAISQPGFALYFHPGITLSVGQIGHLDIHLSLATAVKKITVTDQPSILNPSDTTITSTVGRERIEVN